MSFPASPSVNVSRDRNQPDESPKVPFKFSILPLFKLPDA